MQNIYPWFYLKCKSVLLSQSQIDPSLFFEFDKDRNTNHVDDFLHAGNEDFKKSVGKKLALISQIEKTESKQFKYVSFEIDQTDNGIGILVSRNVYAKDFIPFDKKPERAKQVYENLTSEEKSLFRKVDGLEEDQDMT